MIEIGTMGHQEMTVTEALTAVQIGSGMVRVFATPMMVALIEKAASLSVQPFLEEGQSTVGTLVNVSHCSATPVGMRVWADTEVTLVDRRRVVFSVKAFDERGLIGEGTHERFIIDIEKFTRKAAEK